MFLKTTSFAYTEDLEKKVVLKRRKPESIVSFSFSSDMYINCSSITTLLSNVGIVLVNKRDFLIVNYYPY